MKPIYFKLLSICSIICLGIIIYSNSFLCSFHFDDSRFIVSNTTIKDIHDIAGIWNFLPCRFLLWFSFAVNYHFNQLHVLGYHLVNLGIHLISALLVWWMVLLTLSTPMMKDEKIARHAGLIALFAGLIFVSHPLQTQAVTYIDQRAASMATMFYLLSLCFYIKSRNVIPAKAGIYYYTSLIATVMAMFTKETAITLPLAILLYEYCFFKTKKGLDWKYLAPFLTTILIIPVTMALTNSTSAIRSQEIRHVLGKSLEISPWHYLLTEFRVIITYIRLLFIPINQNLDYDYPVFHSILQWPVLASFLSLTAILWWAKHLFLKYRLLSFAIFWFFLTLLPESSIFPIDIVIFEHRLYLPMVGFSIFLASGVFYIEDKNRGQRPILINKIGRCPLFLSSMLIGIIVLNSILTYQRNKIWQDELSLWNDAVHKSPHKERPYDCRGLAYLQKNDLTDALADFNTAITLAPTDEEAYNNRGLVYGNLGQYAKAMADFNTAIKLDPDDADAQAHNNRGYIYGNHGDFIRAMKELKRAIDIKPDYADAYYNLGKVYTSQGNLPEAIANYTKAIQLNPDDANAHNNRGTVYFQEGNLDLAIEDYTKAIELKTDFADAYYNLAVADYRQGHLAQAIANFTRDLAINPNDKDAYNNRAAIK